MGSTRHLSLLTSVALLLALSSPPACRFADATEPALAALRRQITDDYVRFEKSVEPSAANGFTWREYYQHLFDPTENPRMLALDRFLEFERVHRGTAAGLDAALTSLEYMRYDQDLAHRESPAVYELLLSRYLDFEKVGDACYLGRACESREAYLAFLDRLVERSPHRSVRARALVAKLHHYRREQDQERLFECAEMLAAHYPDEMYRNTRCGELAEQYLAEPHPATALQVGAEAPDLAGYDMNGRPVRLSDYRGQVVALAFFGFW